MRRRVSVVCVVAILMALVSPVRSADVQTQTAEQKAWQAVDSLNKQSLQDFLKQFADGQFARQAKLAIELQDKLTAIKEGKVEQPIIIPTDVLGERWKQWQKSNPNKAVVGYLVSGEEGTDLAGTVKAFYPAPFTGGKTARSLLAPDQKGVPASPTGDGSIIAFATNGTKYELLPGVFFETPSPIPMYFGVVSGKGLVHLKGTGKVTLPDGKIVELEPLRERDVIFVPTPNRVVEKMLELAAVTKNDVVYDLGCGDGRIPVTAAKKFGCKALGFDIDPQRIKESLENVEKNAVGNLVTIEQKDIFTLDLSEANVVTLYLLPSLNVKLIPQLQKLKPGSRIVSHDFDMKGVIPDQVVQVAGDDDESSLDHTVYLWTTPLNLERRPDVIFVPTPQEVVDKMLEMAQVTKDDIVYDLGCGDGRIPVTAAKKFGCKAWGFDIDPQRIKESNENVEKNAIGNLVTIEQKDIFTLDLSKANVVTLYLLPSLNVKLIPQLDKLKPGSRIVSHDFDMRGVTPDQVVEVTSGNGATHQVYLWTAPLKKEAEGSTE